MWRIKFPRSRRNKSVPVFEHLIFPLGEKSVLAMLYSVIKTGEIPSGNGHGTAKGLAKIAAVMANKGKLDGNRIISEEAWDSLHSNCETKPMYPHNGSANFSQGGVNRFDTVDNPYEFFKSNEYRKGFVGWIGMGGSVFQWNPEHRIGFGYTPTFLSWEDPSNTKAALLQQKVVECIKEINEPEIATTTSKNEICGTTNHSYNS